MSWEQGEQAGHFLRPQKVPGTQRCSGEEGSELEVRRASWGLPEAPEKFQGARDTQGVRGVSWEQGE